MLTGIFAFAQNTVTLDQAIENGERHLRGRFPRGTRAAITIVQSENQELSEYVYRKLSSSLINGGWFTVVERNEAALQLIDREMERHLNFFVSEETELAIGKQLGAEIIITGSFTRSGQNWRLDIQALKIETAERAAQWSDNVRTEAAWASLVFIPGTAFISFDGDALALRDRQTIITGLRNAMQERGVALDLDENQSAGAGYGFTVTIFLNTPAASHGLLQAEVTVAFSQGSRILFLTGPYHITETSYTMVARRISERLRADEIFFNRVKEQVTINR